MKILFIVILIFAFTSCGGGGGGGDSSVSGVSYQVGQFLDDPVGGLSYICSGAGNTQTSTGTTDADGHFNYLSGQTCTFKVGNVTLGSISGIPADGKVTPQDVAGVSRSATAAPSALAIAQFLQSLNDGTTGGKIVIPTATTTALSGNNVAAVTLVSSTGSVSQAELLTIVTAAGKTLVSSSTAKGALDTQISSGNVTTSSGLVSASSPVVLNSISVTSTASPPAGLTDQLKVTGYFSDGSTIDLTKSVTWSSSDASKVTVDVNGVASGLVKGSATLTASYTPSGSSNAILGKLNETVLDPTPLNIIISYVLSGITSIQNAASTLLNAVLNFSNATTQTVSSGASWTVTSTSGGGNAYVSADASANTASLTGSSPGVISIIASYLGLSSNSLSLTVSALPPNVQNSSITLSVLGVSTSTATGTISATDPQGYSLSYGVQANGTVGQVTINPNTGVFSYVVSGHPATNNDTFTISVSNGKAASVATVTVTLNTDPLVKNQWHLQNLGYSAFSSVLPTAGFDMNVAGAWAAGYTGKGIKVAVVDSGLEIGHEDLAANVDVANSKNFLTNTTNPTPTVTGFDHGTQVAGIIGSVAFNGKGGRGVAYESTLRGYNFLKSSSITNLGNSLGLATYSADNDIFNESFAQSPTNLDPVSVAYSAINNNLLTMRGGKGAILIQSAGNEFQSFNDGTTVCNFANTYGVSCGDPATDTRRDGTLPIIVGAINANGVKSSYSNSGSGIWVVTPGGEYGYDSSFKSGLLPVSYKPAIVTTSLTGCQNASNGNVKVNALDAQGQNSLASNCQYTALMNGTSSAAPNLSGVVALMLQANSNLGYRDVRHILAKTAIKIDANNAGTSSTTLLPGSTVVLDQGWFQNAAQNWYSNWYGFGLVDANAAVAMAKNYTAYVSAQLSSSSTLHFVNNVTVPHANLTGSTMTFAMSPSFSTVEQAVVTINISSSPALTCNQIELTSPSGTKSILMHAANGFSNSGVLQTSIPGSRFLSNAFYGESSAGNWTLRFLDFCNSTTRTSVLSTDNQTLIITGH